MMKHMLNAFLLDAVFVCGVCLFERACLFVSVVTKKCAFLLRDY